MIQLDDEALNAAITGAIINTISGEKRDELFRNAVAHLIDDQIEVGDGTRHGRRKVSRIAYAFEQAVEMVARKTAIEILSTEPYKSRMRGVLERSLLVLVDTKGDAVAEEVAGKLAVAIVNGMSRDY